MDCNYRRCSSCNNILPIIHFMINVQDISSNHKCHICTKMDQYRDDQTKWCYVCKLYIDNALFPGHVHSNLFTKTRFYFWTHKQVKQEYFQMVELFIRNGSAKTLH